MTEVEIVLQPNGSIIISRGTKSQNDLLSKILEPMIDVDDLDGFFSVSEGMEEIIGNLDLCG